MGYSSVEIRGRSLAFYRKATPQRVLNHAAEIWAKKS